MKKIAILASHNGSGFDAIYEAISNNEIDFEVVLIVSNNNDAAILHKAKESQIDHFVINQKLCEDPDKELMILLQNYRCEYVFLSGYMKKIPFVVTNNFKVINSHPSLLPKFGGVGMYGRRVHEAVIGAKELQSGVTIHEVNENYDEGKILLQKTLLLSENETAETLEVKIKQLEQIAIAEAFKNL